MLRKIDAHILHTSKKVYIPFLRFALFLVFFWFGLLKVTGFSPADELVTSLLNITLPFFIPDIFIRWFGLFEVIIGALFLIKGAERVVMPLLFIHMFSACLPLIVLPHITWIAPFIPTMEGQYIMKNILIIASAIVLTAHLEPIKIIRDK